MKTCRKAILPLALATALALVPAAVAQEAEGEVVPPENSAATQYTEAFPTAGGNKDAHKHKGREASPRQVLGVRNADELKRQGRAGRAVAELTVDTAPAPAAAVGGGGKGDADNAEGGGHAGTPQSGGAPAGPASPTVATPEASGSSGIGAVLACVVGASPSGGGGLLPLLLILATVVWAVAYASRQRQTVA